MGRHRRVTFGCLDSKKFTKIAGRWGELLYAEDPNDNNLWRKRVCLKTKMEEFIMDSFKIIIKGNVHGLRAREINGWNPEFIEDESESSTDVESEGSEDSLTYTDICSGIQGKGEQVDIQNDEIKEC